MSIRMSGPIFDLTRCGAALARLSTHNLLLSSHRLQAAARWRALHPSPFSSRSVLCHNRRAPTINDAVNTKAQPPNQKAFHQIHENPELPKFSLDSLGLSQNMKMFVYVLIWIWATFETYFYGRAIYHWSTTKPDEGA